MDIRSQAETQSSGDLGTSWQEASTQNSNVPAPQIITKLMFSWAVYMSGLTERKSGMWLCHACTKEWPISAGNRLAAGSLVLRWAEPEREQVKLTPWQVRRSFSVSQGSTFANKIRVGRRISSKLAQVRMHFGVTSRLQKKMDMWAPATRGMHTAGQELSELLALRKKANNDNATRWARIKVAPLGDVRQTARALPSLLSRFKRGSDCTSTQI